MRMESEHHWNPLQSEPEQKGDNVLAIEGILEVYVNQVHSGPDEHWYVLADQKRLTIGQLYPSDFSSFLNHR
jgi:hypothetical protein